MFGIWSKSVLKLKSSMECSIVHTYKAAGEMQSRNEMLNIFAFETFGVQMFRDYFSYVILPTSSPTVERHNWNKGKATD